MENRIEFDFISDGNPKTLIFLDKSSYTQEFPEKPKLDIIRPGFTKPHSINIIPNQINVINSSLIGITSADGKLMDIPDGLYHFTYRVCPYESLNKSKYYLRTISLDYQKFNILLSLNHTCNNKHTEEVKRKLMDFEILIETAKAHAKLGNTGKVSEYYREAEKILNSLTNCN